MRAVVTGASGMLGAHVVKKLLEDGWDVISVIRPGSLRKRPWTADILRETEIIEADITQPVSLPQSDVLVHTAGVMYGRTLDVNYRGTLNVIRSANTRWFVLISSILALGDSLRESAREDQKERGKHISGSIAMFIICSAIGYYFYGVKGLLLSAIATLAEYQPWVDDNISVPLLTALTGILI